MAEPQVDDEAFRILVVCTGNLCRSPLAESLLRERLGSLPPQAGAVVVTSAGTRAPAGSPADPPAIAAGASIGVDLRAHRATRLRAADVEAADLVIGLAREHRSAVAALAPTAARRAFTLVELARALHAAADGAPEPATRSIRQAVDAAVAVRGMLPAARPSALDVADPYRRSAAVHRRTAVEIAGLVDGIEASLRRLLGEGVGDGDGVSGRPAAAR